MLLTYLGLMALMGLAINLIFWIVVIKIPELIRKRMETKK